MKEQWVFAQWVFAREDGQWRCERCGDRYLMNMPVSMDVMLAAMRAYGRIHRGCRAQPSASSKKQRVR